MAKKQFSKKEKGVWLYGYHPVKDVILSGAREIFELRATGKLRERIAKDEELLKAINSKKISIKQSDNNELNDLLKGKNHQGIAVYVSDVRAKSFNDFVKNLKDPSKQISKVVILDQITDIGNAGAIIRSAVAFGIKDIFIPEYNSVSDIGSISKASAGTVDKINLYQVTNLVKLLQDLKEVGFWCAGLDGKGNEDIKDLKRFERIALVLGSEGKGIRPLVQKECDILARINISANAESLNVSNAAAITFYTLAQ